MGTLSTTDGTYLANLFNPQVVGDMIQKKLVDAIRFSPLAEVHRDLVGRPGNTITVPFYSFIGVAETVLEGHDVPIKQLTESTTTATILKAGIGVQITDEAVLSAYGNPLDESVRQIVLSLATAMDNNMLAVMSAGASEDMTTDAAALSVDGIADALTLFGEDIDGPKVLLTTPVGYQTIRKAAGWIPGTEIGASAVIRGTVGMVHGCQVVVSNKLVTSNCSYIVKPGALATYMKRDILVERDRDIVNKTNVITADVHFVNTVRNQSMLIKMPGAGTST